MPRSIANLIIQSFNQIATEKFKIQDSYDDHTRRGSTKGLELPGSFIVYAIIAERSAQVAGMSPRPHLLIE